MSGRGWRTAVGTFGVIGAVLSAGAAVGGCSADSPDSSAAPPTTSLSAAPPVGSVDHPRPVDCQDGATATPTSAPAATSPGTSSASAPSSRRHATPSRSAPGWDPRQNDVTVGPLTLQGLRALTEGNQYTHGVHDSQGWHYLIGTAVRADAEVTVTVGTEQRARAGLEFGGAQGTTPAPAVTFHGCHTGTTTFLGAFFLAGDGRACVPLDIRVGDGAPRRVVISFYNGTCPA